MFRVRDIVIVGRRRLVLPKPQDTPKGIKAIKGKDTTKGKRMGRADRKLYCKAGRGHRSRMCSSLSLATGLRKARRERGLRLPLVQEEMVVDLLCISERGNGQTIS